MKVIFLFYNRKNRGCAITQFFKYIKSRCIIQRGSHHILQPTPGMGMLIRDRLAGLFRLPALVDFWIFRNKSNFFTRHRASRFSLWEEFVPQNYAKRLHPFKPKLRSKRAEVIFLFKQEQTY